MSISQYFPNNDPIIATVNDWISRNSHNFVRIDGELDDFELPRRRQQTAPVDYTHTQWHRWITDPTIDDDESRLGKLFRLRFHIAFQIVSRRTDSNGSRSQYFLLMFAEIERELLREVDFATAGVLAVVIFVGATFAEKFQRPSSF